MTGLVAEVKPSEVLFSKEVKSLVINECANFERDYNSFKNACLVRRDLQCQVLAGKVCKYFEEAVLPLSEAVTSLYYAALEAAARGERITSSQRWAIIKANKKSCTRCGREFSGTKNSQYCDICKKIVRRENSRRSSKKHRQKKKDQVASW